MVKRVFSVAVAAGTLLPLAPTAALAHNCTCRNRDGRIYQLGQSVCLSVDGRKYLARCEMNLNVSSWTRVQDGCPLARLAPAGAPRHAAGQPAT